MEISNFSNKASTLPSEAVTKPATNSRSENSEMYHEGSHGFRQEINGLQELEQARPFSIKNALLGNNPLDSFN